MFDKLRFWVTETFYEKPKVYKLNPCDRDCFPLLKPFGRALAMLTTHCPCCTGTRIVLAVAITAMWPVPAAIGMGVIYAALLVYAVAHPEKHDENVG